MTLDEIFNELKFDEWRLVSLSDMSVHGQARWWATLHRHSDHGAYAIDCKFGEGTSAQEALELALVATVRHMQPIREISRINTSHLPDAPIPDLFALLGTKPKATPIFTRRV